MFAIGDLIIYGNTGVCQVEAVGAPPSLPIFDKNRQYYTLRGLNSKEKIYIPVDTTVFMRPIITRQEAQVLVDSMPVVCEEAFVSRDPKELAQHYKDSLLTHTCEDLITLIKTVYAKNKDSAANGRKPGKIDQEYRKRAEALLHSELAAALEIPVEDVPGYIADRVEMLEKLEAQG